MTPSDLSLFLYNVALLPVLFFSIMFLFFSVLYLLVGEASTKRTKKSTDRPFITVQIPSYNDSIAARCIESCLAFSYPKDRYDIMILDDSTDVHTQKLLKSYATTNPSRVSYYHRTDRSGYKPGALQATMHKVRGEFIVIFDSDFIPKKDFLERIIVPFSDKKVAIVQSGQGFVNKDKNLITRFAAYTMMVFHDIIMPLNNKSNSVFFCGTAGAIRVSAMKEAGGWNTKSITEDSDLSVRMLCKGWKSAYIPIDTPSEVPETIESFLRQQMRWCYGNTRVWMDHKKNIWFGNLTLKQRFMITFMTLGNLIAPAVVLMTVAGFLGWAFGDPHLLTFTEVAEFFIKFAYAGGFFIIGAIMLYRRGSLREFPKFILSMFSISIILAVANSVAIYKAIVTPNKPLFAKQKNSWICTPKQGNARFQ